MSKLLLQSLSTSRCTNFGDPNGSSAFALVVLQRGLCFLIHRSRNTVFIVLHSDWSMRIRLGHFPQRCLVIRRFHCALVVADIGFHLDVSQRVRLSGLVGHALLRRRRAEGCRSMLAEVVHNLSSLCYSFLLRLRRNLDSFLCRFISWSKIRLRVAFCSRDELVQELFLIWGILLFDVSDQP